MTARATAPEEAEIFVDIQNTAWTAALGDAAAICRRAAHAALAAEAMNRAGVELSILLTDDAVIRDLNREWRGKDTATDVLSFGDDMPAADDGARPRLLGDVVVAYGVAAADAAAAGRTPGDHLAHLVIHGVYHLLGFDHEAEAEAVEMEARETAVLNSLGIADPYDAPIEG